MSTQHWGQGNIYLRGTTYWLRYSVNGKSIRESAKTSIAARAQKLLATRLGAIANGDLTAEDNRRILVSELLADLQRDYERNNKSAGWCRVVIRHLTPHFGHLRASKVSTVHMERYIDIRKQEVSAPTIRLELVLLRRAFSLGTMTTPKKVTQRLQIPKLPGPKHRRGFFDQSTVDSLTTELPSDIAAVTNFAYYTGCRKGEVLSLRWEWVDLDRRMIELPRGLTKNGEPRLIPLSDSVLDILVRLKMERDEFWPESPWVFNRAGKQIKSFYVAWNNAVKRAGLPEETKYFHDLRRSGVRNMRKSGTADSINMAISGHKTRSVFDWYNITDEVDLIEAMRKLEVYTAKEKEKLVTRSESETEQGPEDQASKCSKAA